jgi:putative redox protein
VIVKLRQIDGLAMVAIGDSGHWVTMDGPEKFGGLAAGSRPMELLLMSLAGCTGMDVVSILRKKRIKLSDFRLEVDAEQPPGHPKVFTCIKLHYVFIGSDIRPADVERAIELSQEKYCAVTAMLKNSVAISYGYRIEPPTEDHDSSSS